MGCTNPRNRATVDLRGIELAVGEQRDIRAQPPFPRRHIQQLQKGAMAHHDLPRIRIGFGKQAAEIAIQRYLVRLPQIDQPGLQVVRVRGKDRVAHQPFADAHVPGRPSPGGEGFVGDLARATGEAGPRRSDDPAGRTNALRFIGARLPHGHRRPCRRLTRS